MKICMTLTIGQRRFNMSDVPKQSFNCREYALNREGGLRIFDPITQSYIELSPEEAKFLKIYLNIYTE